MSTRRRSLRRLGGLVGLATLSLSLGLTACSKQDTPAQPAAEADDAGAFKVLAGSELRDMEPALVKAAADAGVKLKLQYAGTLDIVERVNGGEAFDAILPPNGAYPALALTTRPVASDKLFYSRVALGVKAAKLKALGWDAKPPTWADIAQAAGKGQLRYAMTNPTSSNTGMSALFAVASAVAGKTEDLAVSEVKPEVLKAFLSGQKLTAGSSGWLAEAFVKNPAPLDAMVNYEAVILRANAQLPEADRLSLVYPRDGVISADYPLMLIKPGQREAYNKLVAAFKAKALQTELAQSAFVRPSVADVSLAAGLSSMAVAELSFPNKLDVIDTILSAYQGEWRAPATSIFVLDISGSMKGQRLEDMRTALKVLAGADAQTATARYARFQSREQVQLIAFSDAVEPALAVSFDPQGLEAARAEVIRYADALAVKGGTGIYLAMAQAQRMAAEVKAREPDRLVSIVLLTDGVNTAGDSLADFKARVPSSQATRVFPILFGEASNDEMTQLAQWTGGRVFDGRKAALAVVFKEIRGYQ